MLAALPSPFPSDKWGMAPMFSNRFMGLIST